MPLPSCITTEKVADMRNFVVATVPQLVVLLLTLATSTGITVGSQTSQSHLKDTMV